MEIQINLCVKRFTLRRIRTRDDKKQFSMTMCWWHNLQSCTWSWNFHKTLIILQFFKKSQFDVLGSLKNRVYATTCLLKFNLSSLDPRTNNWPLIASPVPGLSILGLYLYFVNSWGPRFMKDRKPFIFKNTLIVYNFVQVLISVYLFTEVSNADLCDLKTCLINECKFVLNRAWTEDGLDITVGDVSQLIQPHQNSEWEWVNNN